MVIVFINGESYSLLFQSLHDMSTSHHDEVPSELKKKAVIFDLDGTLIDTAGDLAASMNHVLVKNGVKAIPHENVRHLVGFGAKAMLKSGFEQSAGEVPKDDVLLRLVNDFVEYYRNHIAQYSAPFPGMIDALSELKQKGICLAVCTNKQEALARRLLEELHLEALFSAIVGGDTAGVAKPDAAPVNLCLSKMGFEKEDIETGRACTVFVGDSDTDILAARAANMRCLIADFGYGPLNEVTKSDTLFDDYKKAPAILVQMLAR